MPLFGGRCSFFSGFGGIVGRFFRGFGSIFSGFFRTFSRFFSAFGSLFSGFLSHVTGFFSRFLGGFRSVFGTFGSAFSRSFHRGFGFCRTFGSHIFVMRGLGGSRKTEHERKRGSCQSCFHYGYPLF